MTLKFNGIGVFSAQKPVNVLKLKNVMKKREIEVELDLDEGKHETFILTADFSYDYVRINADYT